MAPAPKSIHSRRSDKGICVNNQSIRYKKLKVIMELQKEGWAFGDGGVKNDEDLNMQKRSRGNSVCKGTEI